MTYNIPNEKEILSQLPMFIKIYLINLENIIIASIYK